MNNHWMDLYKVRGFFILMATMAEQRTVWENIDNQSPLKPLNHLKAKHI
jgi:hypothetical protein